MPEALAEQRYWDSVYATLDDYLDRPRTDPVWRSYGRLFDTMFRPDPDLRLVEIGGARSQHVVHLHRRFGFRTSIIDYSEVGCAGTAHSLARHGVDLGGEIICRDVFDCADLAGSFDVVTSFGVLEHFSDPAAALRNICRLLRPGGWIFTAIPNTAGLMFGMYKHLAPEIYRMHQVIDRSRLLDIHRQAGLSVRFVRYFGMFNPGLLGAVPGTLGKTVAGLLRVPNRGLWFVADRLHRYPETGWFSPYIVAFAQPLDSDPHDSRPGIAPWPAPQL
ncbi:MAG: methyltransferase domain-containing protein [Candidatus Krumholzibacteriia bacterium]